MAVYCDACGAKVKNGVSSCCGADVYGMYREDGEWYYCLDCRDMCKVVHSI